MRIIAAPVSGPHRGEQLEQLGLHGDVECGRRLIGDDDVGLVGDGHRHHHRWRIPPDSWCGYCRATAAGLGRPTRSSSSSARVQAAERLTF